MLELLAYMLAQHVDPGAWKLLVQFFGVPGAMMAVVIFAMMKGWVITRREAVALEAIHEERDKEWHDRYDTMKTEKDYWRDLALRATDIAEGATTTAKTAAEKMGGR